MSGHSPRQAGSRRGWPGVVPKDPDGSHLTLTDTRHAALGHRDRKAVFPWNENETIIHTRFPVPMVGWESRWRRYWGTNPWGGLAARRNLPCHATRPSDSQSQTIGMKPLKEDQISVDYFWLGTGIAVYTPNRPVLGVLKGLHRVDYKQGRASNRLLGSSTHGLCLANAFVSRGCFRAVILSIPLLQGESHMARADLLKKLFSSFRTNDRQGFTRIANEIIQDERKKNHRLLADELQLIIGNGVVPSPKGVSVLTTPSNASKEREAPLFEIVYPDKTLSDVILTATNAAKVHQVIREFANWDVLLSNGVYPIRRVLFYGPPGCGKTVTAGAVAAELGLPLIYVRFDAIVSSYLGETAGNLRKVFDFADGDSYVMLFDEFDAIARSRNDKYEHGEIKRVVNAFLQQIDNFKARSLIIAATNYEQSLDYAIWRRFDTTLRFDMPDNNDRITLFNFKLRQFRGSTAIISEFTSDMDGFSHSDVERAALSVMKRCILEGRRMYTKKDVEQAVMQQKELVSLRKTWYQMEG